jgi:chitinase
MMVMSRLIKELEKLPTFDPRGIANAKYRATLSQLLREMHDRIVALENADSARHAGYPGYD